MSDATSALGGYDQFITFTVRIAGVSVPINGFRATSGSYGSLGHISMTTSLRLLTDAGVDLFGLTSGSAGPVEVVVTAKMPGQPETRLFGGEHMTTRWVYDRNLIEIHARDYAGVLVDQRRVLTKIGNAAIAALQPLVPGQTLNSAGVSVQNQKLGQIITSIAQEFGFTPVLHLDDGNPTYGTLYGSQDTVFMAVPQSLWSILNTLARDTGYDVYVTPNKELVFGTPGAGSRKLQLTFGEPVVPEGFVPCKELLIDHSPRRNSTFRVLVMSYDPAKRQTGIGRANYVGLNMVGSAGLKAGLWTGTDALAVDKKFAELNRNSHQVPLYTFHFDGLTASQAQDKAAAIAIDSAKRELVLHAAIDGDPTLLPTQPLQLQGKVDPSFAANTFYLNSIEHHFQMHASQGQQRTHGSSHGGFWTRVVALDIPTRGTGNENGGPLL